MDIGMLVRDPKASHSKALHARLDSRTAETASRSAPELLAFVSDAGFSWVAVARLLGVSAPAIRKWHHGDPVSEPELAKLARFVAFCEIVTYDHLVTDAASWMETPLARSRVTGLDVYEAGGADELVQYAAGHITAEDLLSCAGIDSDESDEQFEIFRAGDGELAIRPRIEHAACGPAASRRISCGAARPIGPCGN